MAYNLGSAYIQVVPTTKGFGKNLEKELGGVGAKTSKGLGGKLFGGLKVAAGGAGVAIGGVLAGSITKGFNRLRDIENAEAKLTGLGHSAETVEGVMKNALASVKGTSFGLGDAAGLAGTLVASGIKPGKELEKTLKLTADSATIAGRELGDMGLIWGSVAAKGKLQGDDAMQLLASGVPIWQMVGDVMGKTAAEAQDLGSKGQVSFEIFQKAMEKGVGGAALESGKTTEGAFKNMGAAMGRFGATLLTGVFPLIGPAFKGLTGWIDAANAAVGPMVETFTNGVQGIYDVLAKGEFTGAENLFGFEEDSGLVNFLFNVREGVKGVSDILFKGDFTKGFGQAFDLDEDSPIVDFLFTIRETAIDVGKSLGSIDFGSIWGNVSAALSPILEGFKALGPVLLDAWTNLSPLKLAFDVLAPVLPSIGQAVGSLAATLGGVLSAALAVAIPLVSQFVGSMGPIVAEFVAHVIPAVLQVADSVGKMLIPAFQQAAPILTTVMGGLMAAVGGIMGVLGPVIGALGQFISFIMPAAPVLLGLAGAVFLLNKAFLLHRAVLMTMYVGQRTYAAALLLTTTGVVQQRIATVASTVAQKAAAVWTRTVAIAQWAWNAALSANPIALVVIAVAALVAGLVYFFTQTKTGQKVWETVWGAIKGAAQAVASWFMNTALPTMKAAWDGIAAGALWLYNDAILPAWNGIKSAIQVVGDWITGTLWPALQTAWSAIGAAAMWLWQNVMQPAWQGIKTVIAVVVTAVLVYIDLLKWCFQKVIAPVAMWLWKNVITPVWNGIKTVIGAVAGWIVNTAWPLIKKAWDAIASAAMWLWNNALKPAWDGIKSAISTVVNWLIAAAWPIIKKVIGWIGKYFAALKATLGLYWSAIKWSINAVVSWFQNTAWPIISKVIGWLKMSFEGWKLIAQTVWKAVKTAIKSVADWLTGTAWPLIKGVIDKIKSGFTAMKDGVKTAWDAVKTKAIDPVVNWLTGTVKPKIDKLTDNIKSAFSTMKDSVLKTWDKIKGGMKEPINGIIRIYNKHVKGNFDKVAEKLDLDTKLPTMNEFATGGYTGPGSKYTPAGIVHADEYVIRKESQNDLRRNAPGLLDSLNKYGAKALGYASGGLVKLRQPFAGSYPRGDGFGARGGKHDGIDYPMPHGAVLKAVGAGHVRHTRNAAAGNKLELVLGNGLVAGYHHLSSYIAKAGSSVGRGADVARVGSTGRSSGPHLHFSLKRDGKYVDPAPYLGAGGSAGSGGGGDWWNPFDGLWSKIKGEVSKAVGGGWIGDVLTKTASNTVGWAKDWVFDKLSAVGDWGMEQVDSATRAVKTARWLPVARRALDMEGELTKPNLDSLMRRMNQESGFNPRAVNDWDSNAKRGTPSKGLMQVIGPTFRAYARPGFDKDIFDPLSNILASIRYTRATYGSVRRGWDRKGGYADGGWTGPGSKYTPAGVVHADEFVVRKSSRRSIESARPGFLDALNRHGASALAGYAKGGLVGYASGGKVSPNAKIGSSKVTVILDGLLGTEKQVKTAAGKLADGIAKTFQDKFKGQQKATVNRLSDSLKALNAQQSQLKKTMTSKSSAAKKSTVNRLSDDLAALKKRAKGLDPKKQAKQYKSLQKQIESTQSALTKARRGDYSGAASATAAKLKDVQKQIASTEAALKQARRGNTSAAATKAADAFFTKYAASATTKLQSLAKQSDSLTAKLKDAKAALTEAAKVRDDYASSLTEKFAGGYALSAESATTGIETIIRGFKNSASTVKLFTSQLGELRSRGLSSGLIDQIAQLGAADGSKVAKNLLSGTDAQIKQITKQYNALNSASTKSGKVLGKQMHQAGVDSARGLVRGLQSQLSNVEKAANNLANKVVSTVRKKLKIKSPSRVFAEIGEFTGEGMVNGIEQVTPDVQSAMSRLATPPEAYSGGGLGSGAAGRGGAGALIENATVYGLSAEDVAREFDKLVRRRESLYA